MTQLPDDRISRAMLALQMSRSSLVADLSIVQPVRSAADSVVFRVGEDVAAKVYVPERDMTRFHKRMVVLTREGGPWVSPLQDPVATEAGTVTFYPWATGAGQASWPEIGALIKRFHDYPVDHPEVLPPWIPLRRVERQMRNFLTYADAEESIAELMLKARSHLLEQVGAITSDIGYGMIHGDVHPGNVVVVDGEATFIDLDMVAWGPKEYDLIGPAMRLAAGEIDEETYEGFVNAYGYDVRQWRYLDLLVQIVDLGFATFLMGEEGVAALDQPTVWRIRHEWENYFAAEA